jgi:mannosyltransferase OCH1-like enzyme
MIPRIIVQSHESAATLTGTFRNCRNILRTECAGFDIRFFSGPQRRKFIMEHRPELLELHDFYPRRVQRSDLFRLVALYELGGFYMDLDVLIHKSFESLCSHSLVLTEEWEMEPAAFADRHLEDPICEEDLIQIGNYAFGTEPRHWFIGEAIDMLIDRAASINSGRCDTGCVFFTTGPDVLSTVLRKNRKRMSAENAVTLRGTEEERWCQFGEYGTHLMAGSWAHLKPRR